MESGRGRGAPVGFLRLSRLAPPNEQMECRDADDSDFSDYMARKVYWKTPRKATCRGWYFRILLQNILPSCDGNLGQANLPSLSPPIVLVVSLSLLAPREVQRNPRP